MTEHEAIKELKQNIEMPFGSNISNEASKLAIKALEKQNPKTPNTYRDGYDNEGNVIYDVYECPCCGKNYEIDYDDYNYCPECGQAIDRSNLE